MKLAVVGSRNFNDYNLMERYLDKIHSVEPITYIVSGGAKGADSLSEKWAVDNNIPTLIFKPDWNKYGKRAGFIRNEDIIKSCNKCISFWDGISKGTKHSINLCKKYNKKCKIIYTDENFIRKEKIEKILSLLNGKRFTLNI